MIIIMSSVQTEMMKKFGTHVMITIFYGTHKMSYDLQLYTIMPLYEIKQGSTCCFIISNREDEVILSFVFSKVLFRKFLRVIWLLAKILWVRQPIPYTVPGMY